MVIPNKMASKKAQPGFDREKLIHLVRDTPCLWDQCTKEYMDSDITLSEWQRIGDEMGIPEEDAVGNESEEDKPVVQPTVKKMKASSTGNARKNIDSNFVDFLRDRSKSLQKSLSQIHQRELDEEGHYGQTIAATLRRLIQQQKARAKILINQALYDVEFNTPYREVLGSGVCDNQRQNMFTITPKRL